MSRHTTFAAFLVTVAVIVPAGWRSLDADIATDGKRIRSLQGTFSIDGTQVTVDVDRGIVMTGDSVVAKLVAFSDTPKDVFVDMTVLQSHNYEGQRIESPQIPIDHEKLTLHAAPGGGTPVKTTVKLGTRPEGMALVDNFRIYVAPHGLKQPVHEYGDGVDYSFGIDTGAAAAVGVEGWSGNNLDLTIQPIGKIVAGEPFTIAVRVKNTSGHRLARRPYVSLATQVSGGGYLETGDDFDIAQVDDGEADSYDKPFKRGQAITTKFTVTPKTDKVGKKITFAATAFESDQEIGPTTGGAMDARTFSVEPKSEANPSVAVK